MRKIKIGLINKCRKVINFTFIIISTEIISAVFLLSGCTGRKESGPSSNEIQAYFVKWWGTPGSRRSRPPTGVLNITNDKFTLRYTIQEGRPLGDYRLPYWGVNSFVSIFSEPAEIAHHGSVNLNIDGKKINLPLRIGNEKYRSADVNRIDSLSLLQIGNGFELARFGKADVLKVTCLNVGSPIVVESYFVINNGSPGIPVIVRANNVSDKTIREVEIRISYTQDFNWSSFGKSNAGKYQEIKAPSGGIAEAFFAYSSGMKKGFEFAQTYGCEISYTLENELNAWSVNIQNIPAELAPGASLVYEYNLCIIDKIPDKTSEKKIIPEKAFDKFKFTKLKPVEIKNAPVSQEGQITIKDVILNLNKPKVRGLNLRAGMSDALTDLKTLKECGCNLVVTDMATPDETRKVVRRGHEYGMEMFMPGEGSYSSGLPPSFDSFFQTNPIPEECPDAYGQDEDHYYWYPVKPTLNFETEFGKLMSEASLEEKVIYWSRCFADKWEKTLMSIRDHDPTGNIWFYMPAPSIANIDPFNFYDQFFTEISKLNNVLTVFPFYYGTDYDQIEYMVRKWKAADVKRVVFLPMRWYMAKPGQFIRAITAARRGGADGSCGFNFAVGAEEPGQEWQWKSVMLAAQANFPTPELNACCFIEEPAELVELLAIKDIIVVSMGSDIREFGQSLKSLLPGRVQVVKDLPDDHSKSEKMYVIIGDDKKPVEGMWVYDIGQLKKGSGKGVIQMSGNIVRLNGSDSIGLMNAEELFLRFAELAPAENKN